MTTMRRRLSVPVDVAAAVVFAAAALLSIARCLSAIHVAGDKMYYHDNIAPMAYLSAALDAILRGHWPVWTYAQNGGQPLWPLVDVQMPFTDPVTLAIAPLMAWGGVELHDIYASVMAVWLVIYLAGLYMLARGLRLPRALALFVVVICFCTVAASTPAQPFMFIHARYVPWVLWAGHRFLSRPGWARAWAVAAALLLCNAGVNTTYALTFLGATAAAALLTTRRWRTLPRTGGLAVGGIGGIVGLAPLWVTGWWWTSVGHSVNRAHLVESGCAPVVLIDLLTVLPRSTTWHGTIFIGLAGSACAILGIVAAALPGVVRSPRERALRARVVAWTVLGGLFLFITFWGMDLVLGRNRSFLTMRNWGWFIPYINMSLAFTAAFSLLLVRRVWPRLVKRRSFYVLVAALLGGLILVLGTGRLTPGKAMDAAVAPAVALLATMFVLARARPGVAPLVLLAVTALHVQLFNANGRNGYGAPVPAARRQQVAPRPGEQPYDNGPTRVWTMDPRAFAPFVNEVPTVYHRGAAFLAPWILGAPANPARTLSHVARTRRYQALTDSRIQPEAARVVLGVDAPIARVMTGCRPARDQQDALAQVAAADAATSRRVAIVEAPRAACAADASDAAPSDGAAAWEIFAPQRQVVRAQTTVPAWVVLGQGHDRWWHATVNGRDTPIHPANVVAMAVPVPAGASEVVFEYRPRPYLLAVWLRLMALAAVVVSVAGMLIRRAGRTRPDTGVRV